MTRKKLHPSHDDLIYVQPVNWGDYTWWQKFKLKRQCHKAGGHWWHPIPGALIDWFCCQCPAETDGMPYDGRRM